ncbi:trace amine-associated receptor 1-like [Stylophora pistillata]|uniref:trace amine-associated receptor 1-like n=1 Tax=Stylophora pistillata TaxID=50429 RepID=UPI000C0475D7|nr:trace amine-associated receptor 1-like [Stylophora pistillata]
MNNTVQDATSFPLCPSLLIKVTSTPYAPNAIAQTVTLLTCIVNGISCPVAIAENLLVFMVVLRKRSLRTTFNTSVLCLAVTDLLIATFIQPAFIAYQIGKYVNSTYLCVPYFIKTVFEFWCVGLSLITLALITLERYFAVFRPFIYRAAVTQSRVMLVIFSGWLFWSAFSFGLRFSAFGMNLKAYSIASSILITLTLLQTAFVYFKLYKVSRIKDHSHSQANRNRDTPNRPSSLENAEAKATKTIIIITGAFFLCFAPTLCVSLVHQLACTRDDVMLHVVYPMAESALFLTALINPAIYVWRNASVRESLKEMYKVH